ncbi:MAG TPA: hypothetical protein H9943_03730 [Candidatus Ruthenibacterium avium]|uniref:Cell division protein FtsL n=1 Tax=Candidatus Ruthenibacterium avium TaxID=2838751 RepID=A0A9D2S158_9FIRM|nr:hypothetical protein [Candidatus Ruthenibacterium avium]
MHEQAALDYDLEVFAPREERRSTPLKVVKNNTKKKKKLFGRFAVDMRMIKGVATVTFVLSLVVSVLVSQATATMLMGDIQVQKDELTELQSEYDYLNNELAMKANITEIEEYAQNQLGLVKMERGQVSYVAQDDQDTVTRSKTGFSRVTQWISDMASAVAEYFKG